MDPSRSWRSRSTRSISRSRQAASRAGIRPCRTYPAPRRSRGETASACTFRRRARDAKDGFLVERVAFPDALAVPVPDGLDDRSRLPAGSPAWPAGRRSDASARPAGRPRARSRGAGWWAPSLFKARASSAPSGWSLRDAMSAASARCRTGGGCHSDARRRQPRRALSRGLWRRRADSSSTRVGRARRSAIEAAGQEPASSRSVSRRPRGDPHVCGDPVEAALDPRLHGLRAHAGAATGGVPRFGRARRGRAYPDRRRNVLARRGLERLDRTAGRA